MSAPYVFTFWQSDDPTPAFLNMCRESHSQNLAGAFTHIHLDFDSCLDWVPERDALWDMSMPTNPGKSHSQAGRRLALFSDLLRMALISRHGGLWIDMDTLVFPTVKLLAEAVQQRDLVIGEGSQGRLSNGVMGARAGSPIMQTLWQKLSGILAEKRKSGETTSGWGEYGGRFLSSHLPQPAFPSGSDPLVLPFGMLLQFSGSEQVSIFDAGTFKARLPRTALACAVLNNATGGDIRKKSKSDLLAENTLFTEFYQIAVGGNIPYLALQDPKELVAYDRAGRFYDGRAQREALAEKTETLKTRNAKLKANLAALRAKSLEPAPEEETPAQEIFTAMFGADIKQKNKSASGCGSSLRQTETLRATLPGFLDRHNILSLLDLPCGDFNWMKHVDLEGITYTGADILQETLTRNQVRFGREGVSFRLR